MTARDLFDAFSRSPGFLARAVSRCGVVIVKQTAIPPAIRSLHSVGGVMGGKTYRIATDGERSQRDYSIVDPQNRKLPSRRHSRCIYEWRRAQADVRQNVRAGWRS